MCYAIPGKVIELGGKIATIEYFGEKRKAYTDLVKLNLGDYVYAQGGFVISKMPETEALEILKDWKDLFFKLQETDRKLSNSPKTLYERANAIRQKYQGNSCCVHGILEFSNYCKNNCLYCGIRKDNQNITRYRMSIDEILSAVDYAVNKLGFKALVLQSGEDDWYDEEKLYTIVTEIRKRCPVLIFLSIGERDIKIYKRLFEAGARGALIRFETCDEKLYTEIKPDSSFSNRLNLIKSLKEIGYLIITGFLVGLQGQTNKDIINNIKLTDSLGAEMFSFGPFIPHPQTPLGNNSPPKLTSMLNAIANARLMYPELKILVTTALETLDKKEGAKKGLMAGANSLMINITPIKYRKLYEIYPDRAGTEDDTVAKIDSVLKLLYTLGRAPTDLGI
ncbi:MAG: [FeFe] hydrogenase H-cluster radical SAM maturase HydE [Planctomycetota bacterium]